MWQHYNCQADHSLRCTSVLLGRSATNQLTNKPPLWPSGKPSLPENGRPEIHWHVARTCSKQPTKTTSPTYSRISASTLVAGVCRLTHHASPFVPCHLVVRHFLLVLRIDHLAGLVVKASASRAEDPGFQSRLRWDFFGVKSYQ